MLQENLNHILILLLGMKLWHKNVTSWDEAMASENVTSWKEAADVYCLKKLTSHETLDAKEDIEKHCRDHWCCYTKISDRQGFSIYI